MSKVPPNLSVRLDDIVQKISTQNVEKRLRKIASSLHNNIKELHPDPPIARPPLTKKPSYRGNVKSRSRRYIGGSRNRTIKRSRKTKKNKRSSKSSQRQYK
jgi:hypothetical protein